MNKSICMCIGHFDTGVFFHPNVCFILWRIESLRSKYSFPDLPPENLIKGRRLCLLLYTTMQRITKIWTVKALSLHEVSGCQWKQARKSRLLGSQLLWFLTWSTLWTAQAGLYWESEHHSSLSEVQILLVQSSVCGSVWAREFCCVFFLGCFSHVEPYSVIW